MLEPVGSGLAIAAPPAARRSQLALRPAAGSSGRRPWAGPSGLGKRCRRGGLIFLTGDRVRRQDAGSSIGN